ncbi:hypothetical protein D9619_013380 [Psilocybe cf. subviscida]|uniref:Uncharacterized protein n=1 Tax=Psilocybe cf. subviscida TaxID=2480587 RepID=A0A8H5BRG3_9AGAR|nr:hypothetical protein D9619_013380 [Psilocybe cf. subviscida]
MSKAEGFMTSTGAGRFAASFLIDGLLYTFSGRFTISLPEFKCKNATMIYGSPKQLTATRFYEGRIGITGIHFNLINGPVITGVLDEPMLPANSVGGTGVWTNT